MEPEQKISIDQFKAIEIRVGKVLSAERVPDTDKLIKCMVDLGEGTPRQILSGIAGTFPDPTVLVGRQFPYVANLAPRTIKGLESNGMILAVSVPPDDAHPEGSVHVFDVPLAVPPGTRLS
jgi:methionyl-tRNA synthetase